MWTQLIESITSDFKFIAPARQMDINHAESALNLQFPSELTELLCETDGIEGKYGQCLIWSATRIEADNRRFRTFSGFREIYMPFDHLLFFGDAGNGDQFAFAVDADGLIRRPDVLSWNHENDSRIWAAPSLKTFFEWWFSGRIRL